MSYPVRSLIRAPKDYCFVTADLSAAESWIVAHLANDPNMKHELANGDLHKFSGRVIHELTPDDPITDEERYLGKKMNHSSSYRTSPIKIAEFVNKEGKVTISVSQARRYHTLWHNAFHVKFWWLEIDEQIRTTREMVTCYGFRRKFYGFIDDKLLKEATAFEPQSTVADHMNGKIHPELGIPGGLKEIRRKITKPSNGEIRMVQTAHDSVLMYVPRRIANEIAEQVVEILRRPLVVRGETFTIPVDCDIYPERWGEGKVKRI